MATQHFISLGAGVQSSTLALLAECGHIKPKPAAAIFADTQAEPPEVYTWLAKLERLLSFPVYRVTAGNLAVAACRVHTSKKSGRGYLKPALPVFTQTGSRLGKLRRQCTAEYKIKPIHRKLRELSFGLPCVQWLGISTDEADRQKDSQLLWISNRYPLLELGFSRSDCLAWMQQRGLRPPRSACVFCPYHSDAEWRRLLQDPVVARTVTRFERRLQASARRATALTCNSVWLHKTCQPIGSAIFTDTNSTFSEECTGVCGV